MSSHTSTLYDVSLKTYSLTVLYLSSAQTQIIIPKKFKHTRQYLMCFPTNRVLHSIDCRH